MSKPLVVSIPHSLGRSEAERRIREGFSAAREKFGSFVTIGQDTWTDDQVAVRVSALGQSAQGVVKVTDTEAVVSVELPWLLARFAEKAQAVLRQQGQLLLEKK